MSSTDRDTADGDPLRPITRGPLATLIVLVVAAAIVVAGGFGLLVDPTPNPSSSPVATGPDASATAPPEGAWDDIGELPPLEPIAQLSPTLADRAGIGAETAFTLTSLGALAASDLAAGLSVEPAVGLRVARGTGADVVTVTPAAPLQPGQRYRFRLRTPDDALAGSWAFTVKQPLHVVTTLPDDHSTEVPLDTGIELTFDQDGASAASSHFTIDPPTEGRFETHGRTLVFVPLALQPDTLYTVSMGAGVGVAGSDVMLEDEVRFRFETASSQGPAAEPRVVLGRTVIEAGPDEAPVIGLMMFADDEEEAADNKPPERLAVEVYRLPDAAAALVATRTLADAPYWATTSAGLVPTDGLAQVLHADLALQQVDYEARALELPEPLPSGAYLLVIPRQGRDVQALVQVTDLASYSLVSTTRSLFWVNELDGGPVAGVEVAIDGAASLGKTDRDGLLVVPTPRTMLRTDDATVLVTLIAPGGRTAIVPLGLTARLGAYPSDIHAEVDPELLGALTSAIVDRRAPAFSLAARRMASPERSSGETLGSRRVVDADEPAILADTSGYGGGYGRVTDDRFWSILSTDRLQYRQADTVHIWGYLRDRDTLQVPADAEVRLAVARDGESDAQGGPALARAIVTAAPSGAFEAAFELADLPLGAYTVEMLVDGRVIASQWITVSVIRKPAYQLEMSLDRHVIIAGEPILASLTARFYEGTLAPGIALSVGNGDSYAVATTGPDGSATTSVTATLPEDHEGLDFSYVEARASGAEEGEIGTEGRFMVFPSARWLSGSGSLDGKRLRVRGLLHEVDLARLEHESQLSEPGYDVDPRGDPIPGARIRIEVIELVPVRTLTGQTYDFITKKSVPRYDEDVRQKSVARRIVRSGAGGRFSLGLNVPSAEHGYLVVMRATDGRDREARTTLEVQTPEEATEDIPRTYLDVPRLPDGNDRTYRTGDAVRVTLRDDSGPYRTRPDAFLFFTAQRGLRDVVVQDSARFKHVFAAEDAPSLTVHGVHFTGRTFVGDGVATTFDRGERTLDVRLETDKARYRPGETATITAHTTTNDGKPVSATVTLRGVDEKLFDIGAAEEDEPLDQLYRGVGDGLYRSYTSHPLPRPLFGNGAGDTGGGRDEFRDTLVFRQFQTGPDGVGSVTVKLADDLTSWHLSAAAVTADLEAGLGSALVPVGLPFFVEATLAPEFVLADRPVLRLGGFGADLGSGDAVDFTISSETLGMAPVTVEARAFQRVDVPLPALSPGEHRLVISGSAEGGTLDDRLTRTFTVIPARATKAEITYTTLDAAGGIETGPGLTSVIVSDAGRGRYLSVLEGLAWDDGARLDQALAAVVARDLLVSAFGMDADDYPDAAFLASAYQRGEDGLALLPYSSPSHDLTVRAILAGPDRFDVTSLTGSMVAILDDPEASRERKIQALAGMAVLGLEVLDDVHAAASLDELTVREQLYLALAAASLGDQATAIELERALVTQHGERRGPWIRIRDASSSDASVEATSLLALVMVEVGDPLADDAEAYVEANPMRDDLTALQRLAFVHRALVRAPSRASRFAYTVDGVRTVVDLEPGASRTLTLTEPQARSLRLEPLTGQVGVTVSRQVALDPGQVTPDPALILTRTVSPAGPVNAGQLVTVDLGLTFGSQAITGCTEVVDQVPSGLAPLGDVSGWQDEDDEAPPTVDVLSPYAISGQRVAFCAAPDPRRSVVPMRYHARVVSPGAYTWEPATAQSAIASELMTIVTATSIELR